MQYSNYLYKQCINQNQHFYNRLGGCPSWGQTQVVFDAFLCLCFCGSQEGTVPHSCSCMLNM